MEPRSAGSSPLASTCCSIPNSSLQSRLRGWCSREWQQPATARENVSPRSLFDFLGSCGAWEQKGFISPRSRPRLAGQEPRAFLRTELNELHNRLSDASPCAPRRAALRRLLFHLAVLPISSGLMLLFLIVLGFCSSRARLRRVSASVLFARISVNLNGEMLSSGVGLGRSSIFYICCLCNITDPTVVKQASKIWWLLLVEMSYFDSATERIKDAEELKITAFVFIRLFMHYRVFLAGCKEESSHHSAFKNTITNGIISGRDFAYRGTPARRMLYKWGSPQVETGAYCPSCEYTQGNNSWVMGEGCGLFPLPSGSVGWPWPL